MGKKPIRQIQKLYLHSKTETELARNVTMWLCYSTWAWCQVTKLIWGSHSGTYEWDIAPCSLFVNRNFGGTYHFHLQGKNKPSNKPSCSRCLAMTFRKLYLFPSSGKRRSHPLPWIPQKELTSVTGLNEVQWLRLASLRDPTE
jgi:hypothetical protein